ncbi:MAG: FtsW/RodA/SpoVE family cell cycle protein [Bacteroidia bacterium]|nr:FtsW/RodA/SpoVE family cell cycle protein [Bacteroidia bacterium]
MNKQGINIGNGFDGLTALVYAGLVIFGWFNIFSVVYDPESSRSFFDFSLNHTKQLIWIATSLVLIIFILSIDYRSYETFAYLIYGFLILVLIAVVFVGKEVNGAKAWIALGSFQLQPAEFGKFATGLALAKYLTTPRSKMEKCAPA